MGYRLGAVPHVAFCLTDKVRGASMARGLSEQQRRILVAAFRHYQQRAERNRVAESNSRYLENYRVPDQWRGPDIPIAHLTRSDALLALHGWRGGEQTSEYWQRQHHLPRETMWVFDGYRRLSSTVVNTIARAEYEVVQASISRTLARLVARGLLRPHDHYVGYDLTEVGIHAGAQFAAQSATDPAEAERAGVGEHEEFSWRGLRT